MELSSILAWVGALGLGAVLSRILEVTVFQKIEYKRERKKWLLDKKLKAYVSLTKEIRSLGLSTRKAKDIFYLSAISAPAVMLTSNAELIQEIDGFLKDLNSFGHFNQRDEANQIALSNNNEPIMIDGQQITKGDIEFFSLQKKGKDLVLSLKKDLAKT